MEISQYIWPVAAFAAGVAAWFCAVLLVLTQALHGHFSVGPAANLQNAHKEPTPRIGGVAIFFSVVLGVLLSGGESRRLLLGIVLAGTPAFAFGLLEDCTHRVSASARLFATLGSGVLGWFVTGLAISDINLPGIDALLAWTPLAVLFTAFCVGGVANAFNIIDGLNGLAGGTALILLSAMGLLSLHLGDAQLAHVCLILAGATLGFLLVNWPFGKLFLGDGGAYFVGFAVAWVAVMLLYRHPEVSAWCSLLICAYPVLEVIFSMLRRRRRHQPLADPDRLHMHSVLLRHVAHRLLPARSHNTHNSVTGALMWALSVPPSLWAVFNFDSTPALALGLAVFAVAYQVLYLRLLQFRRGREQWTPSQRSRHASGHSAGQG